MSLLPMVFSSWWEDLDRPHRLHDQYFGTTLDPEELPSSSLLPYDNDFLVLRPRRRGARRYQPYDRSLVQRQTGASTVEADKNKFQVTLDVQQFAPDELSVKVVGKNVVIEGKHEEKQDEHGWISRQFARKYLIPEQCDIEQLKSSISTDGVLTITAPRKKIEPQDNNERLIKIKPTGKPALREESQKSIENQREQGSQTLKSPAQQRGQDKTVKAA